jgi:hypothetical protein
MTGSSSGFQTETTPGRERETLPLIPAKDTAMISAARTDFPFGPKGLEAPVLGGFLMMSSPYVIHFQWKKRFFVTAPYQYTIVSFIIPGDYFDRKVMVS